MEQQNTALKTYEVEKKFLLSVSQSLKLIEGFKMVDQIELSDTYWKDSGLHLPLRDRWLRNRDGVWQLKIPTSQIVSVDRITDRYAEICNHEDIKQALGIMGISDDFLQDLNEFGYLPWFTIFSTRTVYVSKDFPTIKIVQDIADFGYEIWEVEKTVKAIEEMNEAEEEILSLIKSKNIALPAYVRGKVHQYLYQFKNNEFNELANAGIMK